MKDWVNKEIISEATITVLSDRFNPMDAVNIFNNILAIIKEDNLLSKTDIYNDLIEKIKNEIKDLKSKQQSKNIDYYTGYMSALSTIEGFIAILELILELKCKEN